MSTINNPNTLEITTTSLRNCLSGAEQNYRKAINICNDSFRLFSNICIIARDLESNTVAAYLVPFQLSLQSFLIELRENTRHHRETRNQSRNWVNFKQLLTVGRVLRQG